jgi:hypothetical protein
VDIANVVTYVETFILPVTDEAKWADIDLALKMVIGVEGGVFRIVPLLILLREMPGLKLQYALGPLFERDLD